MKLGSGPRPRSNRSRDLNHLVRTVFFFQKHHLKFMGEMDKKVDPVDEKPSSAMFRFR